MQQFTASKDCQYSYPGQLDSEDEQVQKNKDSEDKVTEDSVNTTVVAENEKQKKDNKGGQQYYLSNGL